MALTNFLRLENTKPGHAKFYELWLESASSGYNVVFKYGKIGTYGVQGIKAEGVTYSMAMKCLNDLKYEKLNKGYEIASDAGDTPSVTGVTTIQKTKLSVKVVDITDLPTGYEEQFQIMQPTPWPQSEVKELLDGDWGMQEKMNGRFIRAAVSKGSTLTYNKLGKEVFIHPNIRTRLESAGDHYAVDGEMIGMNYHIFDLFRWSKTLGNALSFRTRYERLKNLFGESQADIVRLVIMKDTAAEKIKLYNKIVGAGKEGCVFKKLGAIYVPGKVDDRAKAVSVKVKFWKEVSAVATGWTKNKNSIDVDLFDLQKDGSFKAVSVGKVTVPEKYKKQLKDTPLVVRVKYLYATEGHQLYQASLDPDDSGSVVRDDIELDDHLALSLTQLQYEGDGDVGPEDDEPKRSILV